MAKPSPAPPRPTPVAAFAKCSNDTISKRCGEDGCGRTLCAGCGDHLETCQDRYAAAKRAGRRWP